MNKDYSGYSVIMISTDRSIFNPGSPAFSRIAEYSQLYKELNIIVFSKKIFKETQITGNCKVYSTNSFTKFNYISGAKKLGRKIVKKISKDLPILVISQDPFETGLAGKYISNIRKNSEFLIQIHTDIKSPYFASSSILNKIRLHISTNTLPQADIIQVVSERIKNSLPLSYQEKTIVKPIEIDTEYIKNTQPSFNLKKKFPQFERIALMASRLEKEKDIEIALRAWKIVVKEKPNAGLIIVGSGSLENELKNLTHKLNLDKNVVFEGWQKDLIPYYKSCDVFLLTSLYEGYGITLKEAEAALCRIVSTDVGIAKEVGAFVVKHTKESIAECLIKVLV